MLSLCQTLLTRLRGFAAGEQAAVSVDYMVLGGAAAALAMTVITTLMPEMTGFGDKLGDSFGSAEIEEMGEL